MSGLVQRCAGCGAEIVISRRHRGTAIACPKCGAQSEIPRNVDFIPLDIATSRDRERAAWLLCGTVAAFASCCLPATALLWWAANGRVQRARDEDREIEPLLRSTRAVAGSLTVIQALAGLVALIVWAFT